MSITKAAIGLMYHIHEKEFPRSQELATTTIGAALNMRSGKGENKWNFDDFRSKVESNKNLMDYSLNTLAKARNVEGMEYNDLMYQVLASNMADVATRFGTFIGDPAGELVQEKEMINESEFTFYYKRGKGWKWEHTKNGEPLGPHGLHLNESTAMNFGSLASQHVLRMSITQKTPCENWFGIGKDEFTHYWNGWFLTDKNAYAVGYVVQVIALTPGGVRLQLYEEDWDGDFMDNEKNKGKHPRWFFIKDLEKKPPKLQL